MIRVFLSRNLEQVFLPAERPFYCIGCEDKKIPRNTADHFVAGILLLTNLVRDSVISAMKVAALFFSSREVC